MAKSNNKAKLLDVASTQVIENYELAMVMPPVLPDDVHDRIVPKLRELVEGKSGTLEVKEGFDWGKRHLAYEINGNEEGYYIFFDMTLPTDQIQSLTEELNRMKSDVLRFLIIREDQL